MDESTIVHISLESGNVPFAEYAVLLPPGYDPDGEPYRLLLQLHGGGGSRDALTKLKAGFDAAYHGGMEPMVVAMPSMARSQYMDFADGSEKWHTFFLDEFLPDVQSRYTVRTDRQGTLLSGLSMGGLGALRFAFRDPDRFGLVAVLEPAIDPAFEWVDVRPRNVFYRLDPLFDRIYGAPRNAELWRKANPATIARDNADAIRKSDLAIYFECGDEDMLNLHEGAEFLHRVLWEEGILHEYHLVRGANHIGSTLIRRQNEALSFIRRTIDSWTVDQTPAEFSPKEREWLEWAAAGSIGEPQGHAPELTNDALIPVRIEGLRAERDAADALDPMSSTGYARRPR